MVGDHADDQRTARPPRWRQDLIGEVTGKVGSPAIDDAEAQFMLQAIDRLPTHMRVALMPMFLNGRPTPKPRDPTG